MTASYLFMAALAVINVIASVIVMRSRGYTRPQQWLQLGIVWVVPLLGAVGCMAFAAVDNTTDALGSSHDPMKYPADGGFPGGYVGSTDVNGTGASESGGGE